MTIPSQIEIQTLRCSACNKTFTAVPSSGKADCPHCGEKYIHNAEGWHHADFVRLPKKRLKRRKWVHPLKGRTIKEAMADALEEKCPGKTFYESNFQHNHPNEIRYEGRCSWASEDYHSATWNIHSWDSMKDCLKHGFDISDKGEISARENDWHLREIADG